MRDKKSHKLWSRLTKFMAVTLALVLIVGVLPASAASGEIVVKTKKQLVKAMEKKSAATIIFRTNRKTRFIIPVIENSANKKLVMEAPNARAFNKATFKTITLNKSEYFNERGNDNSLYIKGDGVKLTVSKGIEAKKVSITATDVIVKVASDGNVGDIICNKKAAEITVAVAKNAEANITIKKQADLIVAGDKTADITIVSQAADTKITATAPVDIVAEKDVDVVLEKGSEGSSVDSSKGVDVDLSGVAEKQATVTEDGKVVQEAEPAKEEKKEETKKDTTPSTDTITPATDSGQSYVTPGTTTPDDTGIVQVRIASTSGGTVVVKLDNGKTLLSGDKVATGSSIKIVLSPADGKQGAVSINDGAGTLEGSGVEWTVTNIVTDLTITVTFKDSKPQNVLNATTPETVTVTVSGGAIADNGDSVSAKRFTLKHADTVIATVTVVTGSAIIKVEVANGQTTESKKSFDGLDFSTVGDGNHDIITQAVIEKIAEQFVNAKYIYVPNSYSGSFSNGFTAGKRSQSLA